MIVLLLAAGYGTRMSAIAGNLPKSLLPVGDKTVIDYLVDQLLEIPQVERLVLVTNARFHAQFVEWAKGRGLDTLQVLNDGTTCNEDRLGAIGDLQFAIERAGIDGDLMVAGTDNIFQFAVRPLVEFFGEKGENSIAVLRESDPTRISKTAELHLDETGRVHGFVEKPANPTSDLISPPLYIFRRDTLPLVKTFLEGGHSADSPGRLLAWLHQERPVYGCVMEGGRHDIGSPETYHEARAAIEQ